MTLKEENYRLRLAIFELVEALRRTQNIAYSILPDGLNDKIDDLIVQYETKEDDDVK